MPEIWTSARESFNVTSFVSKMEMCDGKKSLSRDSWHLWWDARDSNESIRSLSSWWFVQGLTLFFFVHIFFFKFVCERIWRFFFAEDSRDARRCRRFSNEASCMSVDPFTCFCFCFLADVADIFMLICGKFRPRRRQKILGMPPRMLAIPNCFHRRGACLAERPP